MLKSSKLKAIEFNSEKALVSYVNYWNITSDHIENIVFDTNSKSFILFYWSVVA